MTEPVASNYPSSLDTDVTLGGDAKNFASFTLDAGIDSSTTTVSVTEDISGIEVPLYLLVGGELIYATAKNSGNFTSCDRGAGGTTAASHSNGTSVYSVYGANLFNQLKRAIIAIETELGISPSSSYTDVLTRLDAMDSSLSGIGSGGWVPSSATWTYSSADSPTFVISINADVTGSIGVGMRIKLTQTTAKYFIVTAMGSYSAGATLVTVYGGTDYTLANAAITSPCYSLAKAPFGFPISPSKWGTSVSDTTDRTKTTNTNSWTNLSTVSIDIPIGAWYVNHQQALSINQSPAGNCQPFVTLSTANNSESDATMTMQAAVLYVDYFTNVFKLPTVLLTLTSKTTYYQNSKNSVAATSVSAYGAGAAPSKVSYVSAYL